MKKIIRVLSLVFIIGLVFSLVGCVKDVSEITITYETNGGSAIAAETIATSDLGDYTLPTNPTKEDNEFVDWYLDSELENKFDSITNVTDNITLYAKWSIVTDEVSVTFDTDGGSTVEAKEIDLNNPESFVLPENPTKKGNSFEGWYLDSECTQAFTSNADITEATTLFAKWSVVPQSIDTAVTMEGKFAFTTTIPNEETEDETDTLELEVMSYNADVTAAMQIEDMYCTVLDDLSAKFELNVTYTYKELGEEDEVYNIAINVYMQNSKLYVIVPGELMAAITDGDMSDDTSICLNLQTIMDETKAALITAGVPLETFDFEGLAENATSMITPEQIGAMMSELELTPQNVSDMLDILKMMLPTVTEEGQVTTYSYTNEQVNAFLEAAGTYFVANTEMIYNVVTKGSAMLEQMSGQYLDLGGRHEYEDGIVVLEGKDYYLDADGNECYYVDETESNDELGKFLSNGAYYAYDAGVFITAVDKEVIYNVKNEWSYNEITSSNFAYYVVSPMDGTTPYYFTEEGVKADFDAEFVENYGWDDEEEFDGQELYGMQGIDGYFGLDPFTYYSEAQINIAVAKAGAMDAVAMIEEMYNINDASIAITKDDNENITAVNADLNVMIYTEEVNFLVDISLQVNSNYDDVTVEFPDFTEYSDMTQMLVSLIKGAIANVGEDFQ